VLTAAEVAAVSALDDQIEKLEDALRDWVNVISLNEAATKYDRLMQLRAERSKLTSAPSRRTPLSICQCLASPAPHLLPADKTKRVCGDCLAEIQLAEDLAVGGNRHPEESRIEGSRRGRGR
jgi:hypothetical protein